jgi:hypothetical protein
MPKDKTKNYLTIILVLFMAGYIIHNLIAVRKGNQVNCLETGLQSSISRYYRIQDSPVSIWKEINDCSGARLKERGIYELFSLPLYLIFGVSAQSALYVNFLFLLLLVYSVYKIGSLVKDKYFGALAVFQLLMYPAIFGFTRVYFTPLANTALVSFAVYCILSSDYFRDRRKVILLAFSVIILTRLKIEKTLVYLSAPVIFYLIESFKVSKDNPQDRRKFSRNLFIFILLSILLSPLSTSTYDFILRIKYYLIEICGMSGSLKVSQHASLTDPAFIYLKDLYFIQLGELGFISFILGVAFFLRDKLRHKAVLASWIIIPYLFHSLYYYFSGVHASYYTIAYMPAFALVSACGIYCLCRSAPAALRVFICAVYITLNLANYVAINYHNRQLPFFKLTNEVSFIGKIYLYSDSSAEEESFKAAQALIEEIIATKKKASVVFINHYPLLLPVKNKIHLYNIIKKNNVFLYDFSDLLFNLEFPDSAETVSLKIRKADLIVSGNRFYPALSSVLLENYRHFGSVYDFRQQVHVEEEGFNKASGDFELILEIKNSKMDTSFFLNKKLGSLILRNSGKNGLLQRLNR